MGDPAEDFVEKVMESINSAAMPEEASDKKEQDAQEETIAENNTVQKEEKIPIAETIKQSDDATNEIFPMYAENQSLQSADNTAVSAKNNSSNNIMDAKQDISVKFESRENAIASSENRKPTEISNEIKDETPSVSKKTEGTAATVEPATSEVSDEKPPEDAPVTTQTVKIARVPKQVFDFMVKQEQEDTVRINLTQLKIFLNELWAMSRRVNSIVWDTCDYPAFDMIVPPCAEKHVIVPSFNALNIASTTEKIEEKTKKIRELTKVNYAKMNDSQKKKLWAGMNTQFTIKENKINVVGSTEDDTSSVSKMKTHKVDNVPCQIKPAVPLSAAQGTGVSAVSVNNTKSDNVSSTKRRKNRKRTFAASEEGEAPSPKNQKLRNGSATQAITNKNQGQAQFQPIRNQEAAQAPNNHGTLRKTQINKGTSQQNRNIKQNSGNSSHHTATNRNNNNNRRRNGGPSRFNPWYDEQRSSNPPHQENPRFEGNNRHYHSKSSGYNPAPFEQYPFAQGVLPFAGRDAYPVHNQMYDSSIDQRERRFPVNEPRSYGAPSTYGEGSHHEYRTTFDHYSQSHMSNFNSAYPTSSHGTSRFGNINESHSQYSYGGRF